MKQKNKQTRQGSDNRAFHLMLLVPVILLFIYNILPIPAGILMAFQNFHPMKGFLHSSFVGLANFKKLMLLPDTWPAVRNTLIIAIGKIIGNLVVPISFALLLNEIRVRLPALLFILGGLRRNPDQIPFSGQLLHHTGPSEYASGEFTYHQRAHLFSGQQQHVPGNDDHQRYLEKFRL